jgi:hypothetical protein
MADAIPIIENRLYLPQHFTYLHEILSANTHQLPQCKAALKAMILENQDGNCYRPEYPQQHVTATLIHFCKQRPNSSIHAQTASIASKCKIQDGTAKLTIEDPL